MPARFACLDDAQTPITVERVISAMLNFLPAFSHTPEGFLDARLEWLEGRVGASA